MPSTTDLHGHGDLDAKTDTGSGAGHANEQRGVAAGDFDREINVRGVVWSGVWLVVITLVSALLMWWFLRGIQIYDQHHEVAMTPMQKIPQPPPPAPRLQPEEPSQDRNQDMADMRAAEDSLLQHAAWVDQPGGTLRVPVDVAIDAIAQRGVAPFPPMGGAAAAAAAPTVAMGQTPLEARTRQETANPTDNRKPGATVQNTLPPAAPRAVKPPAAVKPPTAE